MALTSKVLVTGGAGFIGSNLADELIRQGAKVSIIDDLSTGSRENLEEIRGDFEFFHGDINDAALLKKAVSGAEIVFHQAALPSVPRSVENLFAYARLRKSAERMAIVSVDRTADGVAIKLGDSAKVDPERLLAFVNETEGSSFSPSGILRVVVNNADPIDTAHQALDRIRG